MGITVENLTKRYGHQTAVSNLTFKAHEGEVLGFLGPNGAGKTTSLRMIAGLLEPDDGRVLYSDMDIWKHPSRAHRFIGYLPETNPLYPDMFVREAMGFYARIHDVPRDKVNSIIERVGLSDEANKRVRQLSKGYRQRLGLGIAILHDPAILILDEPISGLDPNQLSGIRHLIRELAADKTILFSSHILSEVEQVCDRILILHQGHLQVIDSLKSLRMQQDGRQVIVAELAERVDEAILSGIPSMAFCEFMEGNTIRLVAQPGKDMRRDLYDWTRKHDIALLESHVEHPSMASLFEKLTQ